jgi:hypothetical protein
MIYKDYPIVLGKYRAPQNSVNLNNSLILTGMFRFKPVAEVIPFQGS